MYKWFNKQNRLVQFLLLLLPLVNWVIEIGVRGDRMVNKTRFVSVLMFILALLTIGVLGWIDMIWCLITNHMIFYK